MDQNNYVYNRGHDIAGRTQTSFRENLLRACIQHTWNFVSHTLPLELDVTVKKKTSRR